MGEGSFVGQSPGHSRGKPGVRIFVDPHPERGSIVDLDHRWVDPRIIRGRLRERFAGQQDRYKTRRRRRFARNRRCAKLLRQANTMLGLTPYRRAVRVTLPVEIVSATIASLSSSDQRLHGSPMMISTPPPDSA